MLAAKLFAVAAAPADPQLTKANKLTTARKPMRRLNISRIGMGANGPNATHLLEFTDLLVVAGRFNKTRFLLGFMSLQVLDKPHIRSQLVGQCRRIDRFQQPFRISV